MVVFRGSIVVALMLAGFIGCLSSEARADTVTMSFSPATLPGGGRVETVWNEAGMTMQGRFSSRSSTSSGSFGFRTSNGTDHIALLRNDYATLTKQSGGVFDPISIDLAEYSEVTMTNGTQPREIGFRATLRGGSVVAQVFTLDLIADGPGGVADFETFYFDDRFRNVASLEMTTTGFALDNFKARLVPTPTAAMGGLNAFALLFCRAGRRRTRQRIEGMASLSRSTTSG